MARRGFVGWTPAVEPEPIEWLEGPCGVPADLAADLQAFHDRLLASVMIPKELLGHDHVVAQGDGR